MIIKVSFSPDHHDEPSGLSVSKTSGVISGSVHKNLTQPFGTTWKTAVVEKMSINLKPLKPGVPNKKMDTFLCFPSM